MIIFKAVGVDSKKEPYDASFHITWPASEKPTAAQKQEVINIAVAQFQEYHPTGKILQHFEAHR